VSKPTRKAIYKPVDNNPIQATKKDESFWKALMGSKGKAAPGTKDATAKAVGGKKQGNNHGQTRKKHGSIQVKLGPAAMKFLSLAEFTELNEELMHPRKSLKSKKSQSGRDGKKGQDKKVQRSTSAQDPRTHPTYQTSLQELRPRLPLQNIKRLPPNGESPQLERPLTMPVHGSHNLQKPEKQSTRFSQKQLEELRDKLGDEDSFKRGEAAITAGLVSKKRQRGYLYPALKALLAIPHKNDEEGMRFQLTGAAEAFGIWKCRDKQVIDSLRKAISYAFLKEEKALLNTVLVALRRIGTKKAMSIADEFEAKRKKYRWSSDPATISASDIK
jgi:hypothetical protein